jgi:BioD-like phosphotransacetylase family protein
LSVFSASADQIGYFRPIGRGREGSNDYRIRLMKEYFQLDDEEEDMYGIDENEAWQAIADGNEDEVFEKILKKYLSYVEDKDFVLVSTFTEGDDSLHWAAKLCSALNIPAIIVGDALHDNQFSIARGAFNVHGANCIGAIMSNVSDVEYERKKLIDSGLKPIALLPQTDILARRTVREVQSVLKDGICLYGSNHLDQEISRMFVYTMQVRRLNLRCVATLFF